MNKQIGWILLGIWLVFGALISLVPLFSFAYEGTLHSVLGLVAGVFILARR
ncbi:MAG: hypothetical protein ABI609_12450 [Acidobacteriota bacterium]